MSWTIGDLNAVKIKNKYPLSRTINLFDQLGKAKEFLKIDFHSGLHQVRAQIENIPKTTF